MNYKIALFSFLIISFFSASAGKPPIIHSNVEIVEGVTDEKWESKFFTKIVKKQDSQKVASEKEESRLILLKEPPAPEKLPPEDVEKKFPKSVKAATSTKSKKTEVKKRVKAKRRIKKREPQKRLKPTKVKEKKRYSKEEEKLFEYNAVIELPKEENTPFIHADLLKEKRERKESAVERKIELTPDQQKEARKNKRLKKYKSSKKRKRLKYH